MTGCRFCCFVRPFLFTMDVLKNSVNKIYLRYLFAAMGSALITSIYSLVDCIMVGQYEGPDGTSALAVVMPVWNMIFAFALLFGVGGSVLMSNLRGQNRREDGNRAFTCALICVCAVTAIIMPVFIVFDEPLLRLFGAGDDKHILALALDYTFWLEISVPLFTIGQCIAVFVRNDDNPMLATIAVLSGGIFNIIGDYMLVFVADLGAYGAGLATAAGQFIAVIILLTHFFKKRNTLRLVNPAGFIRMSARTIVIGLPTFLIDMAAALSSTLFNNQIMKYSGSAALAVFGVIINVALIVQSFSSGIGQAIQPIISQNYGAGETVRVKKFLLRGLASVGVLTAVILLLCMLLPTQFIYAFMTPTEEVLAIGSQYMRIYFIAFAFMVFNIFATYYLQATMRPKLSVAVSLLRSIILAGSLIYALPAIFGGDAIWWVMPVSELITAAVACILLILNVRGGLAPREITLMTE